MVTRMHRAPDASARDISTTQRLMHVPKIANRRLKVGLVTGEYPPAIGGIADYTASLADALRTRSHAVSVWTTAAPSAHHAPTAAEVRLVPGWGFGAAPTIARMIAAERPD